MSFDFSTLITDRTAADVAEGTPKGAYNAADLNRVTAALDDLWQRLLSAGYTLPRYKRIKIDHVVPEPPATSRLPEGYTELAWIESTGTQYIDTEFVPNQDTRVVAEMEYVSHTDNGCGLFGGSTNANTRLFEFYNWGNQYNFRLGSNTVSVNAAPVVGAKTLVDFSKNHAEYIINGTAVDVTPASTENFTGAYTIVIHALNREGQVQYKSASRTYYFKIYDNGVLVRDYVPCTNASGVYGLYDMANAQFYGNAGSGSFTGGEAVTEPVVVAVTTYTEDPTEYDPYLWYDIDVPTTSHMTQYLANVDDVRTAFAMLATTPVTPESMALLTWAKANNIEQILIDADTLLTALAAVYLRSGMVWAHSGAAGFYFMN